MWFTEAGHCALWNSKDCSFGEEGVVLLCGLEEHVKWRVLEYGARREAFCLWTGW
jgi:hypothetical protein